MATKKEQDPTELIEVLGARVHNLKNVDISIPRNQLVVFTGLSGSGKSSLAFDTIYAEGQRRYIETLSSYARTFLGGMERPDVDKINGLSPVISIEQKTISRNPRSTVGTVTEIYDFLRLLFARAGTAYSYVTGKPMVKYSKDQIVELIRKDFDQRKIYVLAPVVKGRKGLYKDLIEQIRKMGFLRVRVDGKVREVMDKITLDRYKIHDIEIVIDRLDMRDTQDKRLMDAITLALKHGKDLMMVMDAETQEVRTFSLKLMCPESGISYTEPAPNLFSFNSPYGACPHCSGLGRVLDADLDKIIPNRSRSISSGAIVPLGELGKSNYTLKILDGILKHHKLKLTTPIKDIPDDVMSKIMYGCEEKIKVEQGNGVVEYENGFEGLVNFILRQAQDNPSAPIQRWAYSFMQYKVCEKCDGSRLKKDSLYFKIDGKNIFELASLNLRALHEWSSSVMARLEDRQATIARPVIKEINSRLGFLLDVGLEYLTLDRGSKTLSGGEAQRIRLATQIGSELTGVLYILDEPSIGLHQRDNRRLISSLKNLRDLGNSVIVVEHDKEMIEESDVVVDIGPKAGIHGGKILQVCPPKDLSDSGSLTAQYIRGKKQIEVPKERRTGSGKTLSVLGASGNNLKSVDLHIPLGTFTCVSGVSGSGKSTLINETLFPALNRLLYHSEMKPLAYKSIRGVEFLDKVIEVDQSPIGRTPRSNPATYTGLFTDIRALFAMLPEAKIRGYKQGRFSFNVKGGRCETCQGAGVRTIEMNFLPDVHVLCETCNGKRYNRETLEVRYKGRSIGDVLNMTIEDAVSFFEGIPAIQAKLQTLASVGLGYISLGQPSTTLSGGEAQRVKLATELARKQTGNTIYILDEPTTGLHFEDIRMLLEVLHRLVESGNTVVVIEHNMDVIKCADHVIDIGPEGGENGGTVVAEGTPEEIATVKSSHTARFLKEEL